MTTPTSKWQAAGSANWSNPRNWLGGEPNANSNVVIAGLPGLTVNYDLAAGSITSLTLTGDTLKLSGGSLTVTGAASLNNATLTAASGKSFVTKGATTVTGGASLGGGEWDNYGAVTQSGGAVTIGDSTTKQARIVNEARATWTVTDASGLSVGANAASAFYNYGSFLKTSVNVQLFVTADFYSYGTLASAANGGIEFEGGYTFLSGTFVGSGMIDCCVGAVVHMGYVNVTAKACQTNYGTTDLVGTMTLNDGSTIVNAAGAVWQFDGDVSLLLAAGQTAGPDINGPGTIAKIAGTGTSVVGIDVNASGAVAVNTGTLSFRGDSSLFSGAIAGAGVFQIAAGAAEIGPGATLAVVNWALTGGNTTLGEAVSYAGAFTGGAGATLTLSADDSLTLTGQDVFSGLTVTGSGALNIDGAASIASATLSGAVNLTDAYTVDQTGNLALGGSAGLTIGYGGLWTLESGASILGGGSGSTITIGTGAGAGLLGKTGAGVSTIAAAIVNNGLNDYSGGGFVPYGIGLNAGTLDLKGAVSGTGTDTVAGDGTTHVSTQTTLEFDAAVAATQTIVFYSSNAALFLTDLHDFHAAIQSFDLGGATDSLLVGGNYTFAGAVENATSTTLSFTSASHVTDTLTLTGDYVGKTFAATPAGAGVLRIQ